MDAAVFVLAADPPVSAPERDLYAKVTGLSAAMFTVLNKADHLDEAGQTELLAGAIRRKLPGELGRRSAREHLRRQVSGLAESQTGRARADLQYRLSEASRVLARSMERRYAEATGRMQAALQAAGELCTASAAEAAEKEHQLSERTVALRHALTLLDDAAGTGARPVL